MSLTNTLIKKFSDNLNKNVNLSNYNWFNLGGKADLFFKPNDKKPCFASSGDTLSFYPVSFEQYTVILNSKNQSPYLKSKK